MTPKFKYQPLQVGHIRLATLQPGNGEIEIILNQAVFSSSQYPAFEALSYTWGHTTNIADSVAVISQPPMSRRKWEKLFRFKRSGQARLPVGNNLHVALRHLRQQDRPRVLWIDAICINQKNSQEKSMEIPKMAQIYSLASRVVVWLGPSSDKSNSNGAMQTLSHLGKQVTWDPATLTRSVASKCDIDCEEWFREDCALPYDEETWQSISDIISRPWFSRVWIWQEIGLADQDRAIMVCGKEEIPWKNFAAAAASIYAKVGRGPKQNQEAFENALKFVWVIICQYRELTLSGLIDRTRKSNCMDPRDRIYAMIDVSADGPQLGIMPNYGSPSWEVYRDFMKLSCNVSNRPHLLSSCDAMAWSDELPSWVPNWNKQVAYDDYIGGHSSSYEGAFQFLNNGKMLVNGVLCGTIDTITQPADVLDPRTVITFLQSWMRKEDWNADAIVGGYHELAGILLSGRLRDRYPHNRWISQAEAAQILSAIAGGVTNVEHFANAAYLLQNTSSNLTGRAVFKNRERRVGLAPTCAQPGDTIYAVLGCKTLLVLRPSQNGASKVVGECTLSGFMDLEALLGELPDGFHVEEGADGEWAYAMSFLDSGTETTQRSQIDPRLGEGPPGWSCDRRQEDGYIVWEKFAADGSSYATCHDPRHSDVEFLKTRGVDVQDIILE